MSETIRCQVAVLGGGPGGYTAAFRAADLGLDVVIVEQNEQLGGVCLNVGCIPSKTLLHAAEIIEEAENAASYGLRFGPPQVDLEALRAKKNSVVSKLTGGLDQLAGARKVRVVRGRGRFTGPRVISLVEGNTTVEFENAIIAVGSQPVKPSFLDLNDERIWDSSDALELPFIPKQLAVLGGGIIGLEMAQVYAALGSRITIVEMMDQIIPPADADLVRPLAMKLKDSLHTSTKLTGVQVGEDALTLSLDGRKASKELKADALLVSVGRRPNSSDIGARELGIAVDAGGFITVDTRMQTSLDGIYAVGDVAGNPMLAHKAVHEGKVAAEVIAGLKSAFTPMSIPSVAYTTPEISWVGYTEKQAKAENIPFKKSVFPWAASGRALSADASGFTKLLFDEKSGRLIGAGIVGARAGDLIAEATLAIEMGADAVDLGGTIHAHPTFAETLGLAAEIAEGSVTDILPPKKS